MASRAAGAMWGKSPLRREIVAARFVERPKGVPQGRLGRAQAEGITYQRKVGQGLQRWAAQHGWLLRAGPWIECTDSGGHVFFRQPDFVMERGPQLAPLIFEVKLSESEDQARKQLWDYCRALALAHEGHVLPVGFQVCKRLRPEGRTVPLVGLAQAVRWQGQPAALAGTVQWLGW